MKPEFLTNLKTEELPDGFWRLESPLIYQSKRLSKTITVPAGFITNFMSVPRWPFIYAWLGDKYRRAGALHDFLYQSRLVSRWSADSEMVDALHSLGASDLEMFVCWAGVRIGGGDRYGKND